MKTINYNAINDEILANIIDLQSGVIDCYNFIHDLSVKHIEPVYPECMDIEGRNPCTDLLFAMFEINNIELY